MNVDELLTELECALKAEESDLDRRVDVYNRIVSLAASYLHIPHPVVCPQLVPVDDVRGNDYNPNKVAPPEMRLLKLSIHKDGFTMPVVVARDGKGHVVVDGFHRRQVAKTDVQIRESLGGYLPVVRLDKSIEDRITSTVRHNMARGTHQVELTARLVTLLRNHSWTNERIGTELGMAEADARPCRSLCRPGILAGMGYVFSGYGKRAGMNCTVQPCADKGRCGKPGDR